VLSLSQCFTPDASHRAGGMVRVASGELQDPLLVVLLDYYASTDCSGPPLEAEPRQVASFRGDSAGAWVPLAGLVETPSGALSALVIYGILVGAAEAFTLHLDDTFVFDDEALFLDEFESGDTSAWSIRKP